MALKTDYQDQILDTGVNTSRHYSVTNNADNTISLTDVSVYTQDGDDFTAGIINTTNAEVNNLSDTITNMPQIVETGTDANGWHYQKYSDNTYHAWQVHTIGTSTSNATKTQTFTLPSFNSGTDYAVFVTQNADTYVVNSFRVDTISASSFRVVIGLSSATTAQPKHAIGVWGTWS